VTFHSEDGHDEITLSAAIQCVSATGERKLSARDFTSIHVTPEEIAAGATIEQSARILTDVLSGKGSPAQEAVVCANAALAMLIHEGKGTLAEYVDRSREAIRSGRAIEVLQRSVELT
jgi:anthranilate phosphoribosyltransferase